MPAIIEPAAFRDHFETGAPDSVLEQLIADAEERVVEVYGPHSGSTVERFCGGARFLFLDRRATSVASVVETVSDEDTTLAADDYRLEHDGAALLRLNTGTNQRRTWGAEVEVTYTPESNAAQRLRVVIDLVKLALQYRALENERAGDYSAGHLDYDAERDRILSTLRSQWTRAAA